VTLVDGRLADPTNLREVVLNAQAARELGVHLGSVITVTFNSDAQELASSSSSATPPPV